MKIVTNRKLISLLLVSAGLAAASAAHASDGTITFTGNVISSTCKINGDQADVSVALPHVGANALGSAGATAGRTPFSLALTECASGGNNPTKVAVVFESGANVDQTTGRLTLDEGTAEAPAAKNVQISVLNDQQQPIKVGAEGDQGSQVVDIVDGTAQLNYFAEYHATDKAEAGAANSKVQYSLTYQ